MPGPSEEPENYTIHQMMDALTAKSDETSHPEGELVTRADGSQAIKVRRRKRRSHQPQKEAETRNRRLRIWAVISTIIFLTIATITFGGLVVYSNSSPYRAALIGKISSQTGAEVRIHQFRMNPGGINAGELQMKWPAGNTISHVTLKGIRASTSLSSLFSGTLSGNEMIINEGNLEFQPPKPGFTQMAKSSGKEPFPVLFERYGITRLSLAFGKTLSITKTEGSLYPTNLKGNTEVRLRGGTIAATDWPSLRLDRALLECEGQDIELRSLSAFHDKDELGTLLLTGTLHPLSTSHDSILSVKAEFFQLAGLLSGGMERFISGRVNTTQSAKANYLAISPGSNPTAKLVLAWNTALGSQIELGNLSFLYDLSQLAQDPGAKDNWYEHPAFISDGEGMITREGVKVTLSNLKLVAKGRMAIKGQLTVNEDKTLTGELQVGLTHSLINASPTKRLDEIFGEQSEGFRWITLTISGTVDTPKDNLRELLASAEALKKTQEQNPYKPSSFEELTRPHGQ